MVAQVIPCAWLALVIAAYAALALFPLPPAVPMDAEVPEVQLADRAVLPLLAALVAGAIIVYFGERHRRPGPAVSAPGPLPESGAAEGQQTL